MFFVQTKLVLGITTGSGYTKIFILSCLRIYGTFLYKCINNFSQSQQTIPTAWILNILSPFVLERLICKLLFRNTKSISSCNLQSSDQEGWAYNSAQTCQYCLASWLSWKTSKQRLRLILLMFWWRHIEDSITKTFEVLTGTK